MDYMVMLKSAILPGAFSRQRLVAAAPVRGAIDATAGGVQSWPERWFLVFGFLILQAAFIGLSISASAAAGGADGSDTLHMLAFAMLLLVSGVFARKHFSAILSGAGANLAFFVLPAILIASATWSVAPSLTLKRSILALAVCGFDLYVAATVGLDRLLKLLSLAVFISALASVVVAIALPSLGREVNEGLIGDWRGVFPQKNTLGQVVSVGVFVEMALMIRAHRLLLSAVARTLLLFWLLAMAHSASSVLCAMLAVICAIIYSSYRGGGVSFLLCAVVTAAAIIFLGGITWANPEFLFAALDRDPSLTGRTDLWLYVERAIQERPWFGWGYEAFWVPGTRDMTYIQNQIQWAAPYSHNGYLETALGAGLLGLAGLAVTTLWALRRIVVLAGRHNDLGGLLWILSIQLVACNLTESFLINASVFIWNVFVIFGFKAGIALRQQRAAARETVQPASILDRAKPRLAT